jgi:hypothetical protein
MTLMAPSEVHIELPPGALPAKVISSSKIALSIEQDLSSSSINVRTCNKGKETHN